MRDYLYKAKRVNCGEWEEGYLVKAKWYLDDRDIFAIIPKDCCFYPLCEIDEYIEVDPDTVCMATEYTKDNKHVFENDIVKYDDCFGIVKFGKYRSPFDNVNSEHYGFYIEWQEEIAMLRRDIGFWMNKRDVNVVGNVFDNKDFL